MGRVILARELRRCLLVAAAVVLAGCANTGTGRREPTPGQDFKEYQRIVVQAMSEVDAMLRSLDQLSVQASRHPHRAYQAFAEAVSRLEVGSIEVRARAQAIRVRGEAYFAHWTENLAGVKNEQLRQLAQEHQAELKESFNQIRLTSQQIREAFRPFLSDLQKLRAVLEAKPTLAGINAEKDLILATGDKGRQVQEGLDRILAELNSITALLRPAGPHAKP